MLGSEHFPNNGDERDKPEGRRPLLHGHGLRNTNRPGHIGRANGLARSGASPLGPRLRAVLTARPAEREEAPGPSTAPGPAAPGGIQTPHSVPQPPQGARWLGKATLSTGLEKLSTEKGNNCPSPKFSQMQSHKRWIWTDVKNRAKNKIFIRT